MELRGEFQGAKIPESNPEDHLVLLFLEAEDQLRMELGWKFSGTKLSDQTKGCR